MLGIETAGRKIVQYIEQNPVTACWVERAEDWRWSSAFRG